MISTNFFKLIENLLLPYLEKIKLNVHQFAYRKNTSTTLANTIFREAIGCNIDGEGTIYTCPLDLSKAFERVDHQTLIKKLKEKRIPQFITSVFEFILSRSRINVNFNGSFSEQWKIVTGHAMREE